MFAALEFDREPLTFADIPAGVTVWLQVVGGFAFLAVLLWLPFGYLRMRRQDREQIPLWMKFVFAALFLLGVACYVVGSFFGLVGVTRTPGERGGVIALWVYYLLLAAGGACFVLAVAVPFVRGLFSLSFRRIYALAKLSFKEALSFRVPQVLAALILLVGLFIGWFVSVKPEDEVRTYVVIVFYAMTWALLLAGVLVSGFSIPADIKNQTIHTIVTKPVQRFEIVLGRFLGFLSLMTLILVAMTAASLVYVLRGVHHEAAEESLKAREPLYGMLRFENTNSEKEATNVGREWDYRSYITGRTGGQSPQTARWDFAGVPGHLEGRDRVRFEYTFDIYRTTKGEKEGSDVTCTVRFYTWRFRPGNDTAFRKERGLTPTQARLADLAEKYGYYEINGQRVTDYHTQGFSVPGTLFKNLNAADPGLESELKQRGLPRPPDLTVRVTNEDQSQYIGMARHDLYARLDDPKGSEQAAFALNFFKAAFGLWLQLALVIGLAVVLSTYLSGVISLLVTGVLVFFGFINQFIEKVALGKDEAAAGPAESILRIYRREITGARLDESQNTTDKLVFYSDDTFRWFIRRILKLFPDVNQFALTDYVKEGFNITWGQMGIDLLLLGAYLLPWFVLAYFLMRWREIASST